MGHIIIEGLDKTGKSTLARHLSEKLGMPIKKFSAPEGGADPTLEYAEFLVTAEPCIVDRCYMSEMAYGPVVRGVSHIDLSRQSLLEELVLRRGGSMVYCDADEEALRDRFEADGETFLKPGQIAAVKANFEEALNDTKLEVIRYTVGDDMDAVYEQLR